MTGRSDEALGIGIFLTYLVPPTLLFLPLSRVIAVLGLQNSMWSLVLVYTPVDTPFTLAARAAGLSIMTGYELFLYQGIDAFRHFTGRDVSERPLREALKLCEDKALASPGSAHRAEFGAGQTHS